MLIAERQARKQHVPFLKFQPPASQTQERILQPWRHRVITSSSWLSWRVRPKWGLCVDGTNGLLFPEHTTLSNASDACVRSMTRLHSYSSRREVCVWPSCRRTNSISSILSHDVLLCLHVALTHHFRSHGNTIQGLQILYLLYIGARPPSPIITSVFP